MTGSVDIGNYGEDGNEDTCFPWKNLVLEDELNKAIQEDEVAREERVGEGTEASSLNARSPSPIHSFAYVYYLRYTLSLPPPRPSPLTIGSIHLREHR